MSMHRFSLQHLSDAAVREALKRSRARERSATATLVAHIAEAEARKLYLEDACDSMATYCTRELGFTEDEAYKRIHAGRAARRFPEIFSMLEDGRLHLTAVNLLAPKLTEANAGELLASACGKSKVEIQELLAGRFPQTEPLELVVAMPREFRQLVPERVERGPAHSLVPERVDAPPPARAAVTPHAAGRYTATVAMDQATHDELRECAELLGHVLPSANAGEVIAFALHHLVVHLRKRKFGATKRPARVRPSGDTRHVPAHVRRAVHERDGGCCTFTRDDGRRCGSRTRLEFDHVLPVARGGETTVDNLRLRCRAHNQHEAERTFGEDFMAARREAAQVAAAAQQRANAVRAAERDVIAALRALGYRSDMARHAAAACVSLSLEATLEQRVKHALRQLLPPHRRIAPAQLTERCDAATG